MQLFLQMPCCSSLVGFLNVCWHLSNNANKYKISGGPASALLESESALLESEITASSILLI